MSLRVSITQAGTLEHLGDCIIYSNAPDGTIAICRKEPDSSDDRKEVIPLEHVVAIYPDWHGKDKDYPACVTVCRPYSVEWDHLPRAVIVNDDQAPDGFIAFDFIPFEDNDEGYQYRARVNPNFNQIGGVTISVADEEE